MQTKYENARFSVSRSMGRLLLVWYYLVGLVLLVMQEGTFVAVASPVATTADAVGMVHPLDQLPIYTDDGPSSWEEAERMMDEKEYDHAALHYWRAVLLHGDSPKYSVQDAFQKYMQCFILQQKPADGLSYVALESYRRSQQAMGDNYVQQALQIDPSNEFAKDLYRIFGDGAADDDDEPVVKYPARPQQQQTSQKQQRSSKRKTPEELYEKASDAFANKDYETCADEFELSCQRSNRKLYPSCSNAVYCRTSILDWGFNGTDFEEDMKRITKIIKEETSKYRQGSDTTWHWQRSSSIHPHMMLGFPVEPTFKRQVTESVAFMDEKMARVTDTGITPLPSDLPFSHNDETRESYLRQAFSASFKIKVGFVGSGFNSKAVLYLSQDIFRFFDQDRFEIHIFSVGPEDNPLFIEVGMRGVDWRQRVKSNVENFHDVQHIKGDHIALARFIRSKDIHILIEWDGFARQGERAQGLFALRPAPIQILHQEYLGTSGATYVDYLFTDLVTSPERLHHLYTEKLIYMPNHFFSKGHAVQAEVHEPSYTYQPMERPYRLGTGSPQENRCLSSSPKPSIVFCNFNKFLKNNPETVRSWIRILREVPDSILCLLENPTMGVPYLRKFIHEAAGTSEDNNDPDTFVPGDGDELNERIHFLEWERNPFDHQQRNHDFCNVMLDSYPYNGHTVAQDSLYAGVPIVTRSDGDDMCSRVTTSANIVLGMPQLNAIQGPTQYENIAIALGNNATFLKTVRTQLIDTTKQRNPMHPYWDVPRYVKNFEQGLEMAWQRYLDGMEPDHIYIQESAETKRGTYNHVLEDNPSDGTFKKKTQQAKNIPTTPKQEIVQEIVEEAVTEDVPDEPVETVTRETAEPEQIEDVIEESVQEKVEATQEHVQEKVEVTQQEEHSAHREQEERIKVSDEPEPVHTEQQPEEHVEETHETVHEEHVEAVQEPIEHVEEVQQHEASATEEHPHVTERTEEVQQHEASATEEQPHVTERTEEVQHHQASATEDHPQVTKRTEEVQHHQASATEEHPHVTERTEEVQHHQASATEEHPRVTERTEDRDDGSNRPVEKTERQQEAPSHENVMQHNSNAGSVEEEVVSRETHETMEEKPHDEL